VIGKLNAEFVRAARTPEAAAKLAALGLIVRATSAPEAQAFMDAQRRELGAVIKDIGIQPQ
jgi:tripartite-type tricarboxylate transporter receptor subunit TctC